MRGPDDNRQGRNLSTPRPHSTSAWRQSQFGLWPRTRRIRNLYSNSPLEPDELFAIRAIHDDSALVLRLLFCVTRASPQWNIINVQAMKSMLRHFRLFAISAASWALSLVTLL